MLYKSPEIRRIHIVASIDIIVIYYSACLLNSTFDCCIYIYNKCIKQSFSTYSCTPVGCYNTIKKVQAVFSFTSIIL